MALITLSIADVYRHIRPEEVLRYSPPEGETLDTITAKLLTEQCDRVTSYVNATGNPRIKQGMSTVPAECVAATLALTRYAILALIPGQSSADSLAGSTRRAEYDDALRYLDDVASGKVRVSYDTVDGITESSTVMRSGINQLVKDWGAL